MTEKEIRRTIIYRSNKSQATAPDNGENQSNESMPSRRTPASTIAHRIFAPLNTPWYRRCQTLTILVWWLLPWFCLYLTISCLRSDRWYFTVGIIVYITWMVLSRKYHTEGGLRQQWLRRLVWWRWFAGLCRF